VEIIKSNDRMAEMMELTVAGLMPISVIRQYIANEFDFNINEYDKPDNLQQAETETTNQTEKDETSTKTANETKKTKTSTKAIKKTEESKKKT